MKTVELPPPKRLQDLAPAVKQLEQFADLLMPADAEPPILTDGPRLALFEWMKEIDASADLEAVGAKPRRTGLLYGPPGCGKTTFAHHFAARLGLPLALVRSESLVTSALGGTGKNIGQLFEAMARSAGQAVIFLDEVDSIGGKRKDDQGASVEMASALTVLLRRVEQFNGVMLAATNRHDALDRALWRRFDMQIEISLPGADERFAILKRYLSPFDPEDDDVDLLVNATKGASPALLKNFAEGIKRSLVMWPRYGRSINDPLLILATVIAGVAPAPGIEAPPLWCDASALAGMSRLNWPWPLPAADEKAA